MANAEQLAKTTTARVLLVGYPGAGKTGSLASLANAGLKLRILAYDKLANFQPLFQNTEPQFLKNIDIVHLEDRLRGGPKSVDVVGIPTAFADGLKLLDKWTYEETDLGSSKDWGPDTVVVVDSLTAMGEASMRRAMAMANRTVLNRSQPVWGHAMADQMAFLERLLASGNNHHVVVTAHLKTVGPDDVARDDADTTRAMKARLIDLVPTRLYPSALGKDNARKVASLFSTVLLCEPKFKGGKLEGRYLFTQPRAELDLKAPALKLPAEIPISTGLLDVFEAVTGGRTSWFNSDAQKEKA